MREQSTRIFGRDAELSALRDALEHGGLTILVGAYGVGKTRLAEVAAAAFSADGERASSIASLEGVATLGEARDRVARALGTSIASAGDRAMRVLSRALEARGESLLVLDGCDAVAELEQLVRPLLEHAPDLRILATTRRRPPPDPTATVIEIGALSEGAAAGLFVARARAAKHDFALAEGDAAHVDEIVRALDGNPLAIELAASRAHVMSPRVLLHRLASRFDVLKRTASSGQRAVSLEAAIEGSCRALGEADKEALALFTVFRGSFDLDAAEAVFAAPVLDVVQALRDSSLLAAREDGRVALPESVRAYAVERLAAPALLDAAEARHAAYFATFAEAHAQSGDSRLAREHDNLLAVVDRILGRSDVTPRRAEPALRVLLALAPVVLARGPLEKYATLLAPVIDATLQSGARPDLIARSLVLRAALGRHLGRAAEASRDLARASALARTLGSRALEAEIAIEAARGLRANDDPAATGLLDGALAFARSDARRDLEARALGALAAAHVRADRLVEARIDLERAFELHSRAGADFAADEALADLGHVLLELGEDADARARLEDALARADRRGDRYAAALTRARLGLLALCDEPPALAAARDHLGFAERAFGDLGYRAEEAIAAGYLGVCARFAGHVGEAYATLAHASDRLRELEHVDGHARFAVHRAALELDVDRAGDARAALEGVRASSPVVAAMVAIELGRAGVPAVVDASAFERRLDVRLLRRCHARVRPPLAVAPAAALVVAGDGAWFCLPDGPRVVLDRRPVLKRLLARLASARAERAGQTLDWEALLEAGWPREKVIPEAGAHRVRVSVSTLRKLGLKDALETVETGYRLTPSLPLEIAPSRETVGAS